MHIIGIHATNVIGLERAEIVCREPITLISGSNEAGKTSLCDAISLALTGELRRVAYKKDLGQLVHDRKGAKKGKAAVQFAEGIFEYTLPKGEHTAIIDSAFLPFVLDAERFSALKPYERRELLFTLTNCRAKVDDVQAELQKAGCSMELAEQILPLVVSGFPAAHAEAKERISQTKGEWKAITGEPWGSDKADGWTMELPTAANPSDEEIAQARGAVTKTQQDIENGIKHQAKLEASAPTEHLACPCCQATLAFDGNALINVTGGTTATQADDLAEKLRKTADALADLRAKLPQQQAKLAALEELRDQITGAKEIERKAAEKHAEILAWQHIAEQLAPAGLPALQLQKALGPVNTSLATMAGIAGWKETFIHPDMQITYGGRLLALNSESARWRANCLLAMMIAQLSNLRFAVLDRFDVLQVSARPELIKLVSKLAELEVMDSIVLCGTLKAPVKMPGKIQSLWIENGVVVSEGVQ